MLRRWAPGGPNFGQLSVNESKISNYLKFDKADQEQSLVVHLYGPVRVLLKSYYR